MKRLLAFGGFTDDADGVLAAVQRLALVGVKLCLDTILELRIASLTDTQNGYAIFSLHDPELALLHDCSLAHLAGGHRPVEIKRHHYPGLFRLADLPIS
jgi:hypothetical protein